MVIRHLVFINKVPNNKKLSHIFVDGDQKPATTLIVHPMKTAVFPGSFDPITNAHLDIIERALPLFDKLYVAIGINDAKTPYLSLTSRETILKKLFRERADKIIVDQYKGLTIDYCKQVEANYIIRGLRSISDFEFEQPISQNNQLLAPKVQTVFLISSPGLSHISSTIVRDIHRNHGDIQKLVPPEVIQELKISAKNKD